MSHEIYALDTETGPYDPTVKKEVDAYALEPYRPGFFLETVGAVGPGYEKVVTGNLRVMFDQEVLQILEFLEDIEAVVYCHNTIFDIAALMSRVGYDAVKNIRWRDTSILAKWVNNSQGDERFEYRLKNCVAKWLPNSEDFVEMKNSADASPEYWLKRALADCVQTRRLAEELERLLPMEQMRGYTIECACLLPLARGWVQGILTDMPKVMELDKEFKKEIAEKCNSAGIAPDTISSSVKLGNLLFKEWGLKPLGHTAGGKVSVDANNLKRIALKYKDEQVNEVMAIKKLMTVRSKYLEGFIKAWKYLESETMHPNVRLFNSYTGRMAYSSKLKKKFPVGIALQQLPRKFQEVKRVIIAPDGYTFLYMDYSQQELRLMAHFSDDPKLIEAYQNNLDLHAMMAETIFGVPYQTIVDGVGDNVELYDMRQCGKLTNLSSMYRIYPKSLADKFFEQYGMIVSEKTTQFYLFKYKTLFKGIPRYWAKAVGLTKRNRYAETLAHRRYYIDKFDWKGESSAINFPIQGSGADLTSLAICLISKQFPELIMQIVVHDSITWLLPVSDEDSDGEILAKEIKRFANTINYSEWYGVEFKIPFPFDVGIGKNLSDIKKI